MPANYADLWLSRVEKNLTRADKAPWLDGIPELDTPVVVFGAGEPGEKNTIHIPTSDFEPNVLVDNTSYPLALVEYSDDEVLINLHKFQTEQTSIGDDQITGSTYDKIDSATQGHTIALLKKKYARAIHALAPAANTALTPVLLSTGRTGKFKVSDGTEIIWKQGNRLRLTYDDLVDFRDACVAAGVDMDGMRLVLCDNHITDLLKDRENFGNEIKDIKSGQIAPIVLGFKMYSYVNCPDYNGTSKLPFGTTPTSTQFKASVAFYEGNVAKKTGKTRQYFSPASTDTATQSNKLNYRHYFIACPKRLKYIAAITSGIAS